jgi:HlyD family secretion protein
MKKLLIALGLLVAAGAGGAYYLSHRPVPEPVVTTSKVTQGDVIESVGATGTLQAVTTVQVGSQVSGTIAELRADYNSLVHRGELLARLDPSLFQTQVEQARANLVRSQADVERLKVTLEDARTKLARAQELARRQLVPKTDLETAQVNVNAAEAQIKSSEAQVVQAQASLNQSQVNLEHTVITAPIDGIVVSRNVDVGQTVAASMQAPTLFILAADLTKMQVVASLDESDVGRIRPNQAVHFRVDAYPTDDFTGTVTQVRLQPQVQQNVVTYSTVISVPNPELKLKPGMTANVTIEIARRNNVIRVPTAALRFRPTNEIYAALGQTPEPTAPARGGNGTQSAANGARGAGAGSQSAPPAAGGSPSMSARAGAPSGNQGAGTSERPPAQRGQPGAYAPMDSARGSAEPPAGSPSARTGGAARGAEAGSGFADRLQGLSPEERERALQRMGGRGLTPPGADAGSAPTLASAAAPARGARQGGAAQTPAARPPAAASESLSARNPQATTIDALFGPLPQVESTGRVWIFENKQLRSVRVRLGIADGQASELLDGALAPGTDLVTNITVGQSARPAATTMMPFMGGGGPPGMGGGMGGGRGGR